MRSKQRWFMEDKPERIPLKVYRRHLRRIIKHYSEKGIKANTILRDEYGVNILKSRVHRGWLFTDKNKTIRFNNSAKER